MDQQETMFKLALDQALDAVVTIDQTNLVTYFNRAAEQLWGVSADKVIGQNVKILVPAGIRGDHDTYVNANRTTNKDKIVGTSRDIEVERFDGSKVWCKLSISKLRLGNGNINYTAFVKDITDERTAQRPFDKGFPSAANADSRSSCGREKRAPGWRRSTAAPSGIPLI